MVIELISKSLVVLVVFMVVVGIFLGVSMAGAEFLNPSTAAAEAHGMEVQTRMQERINDLEIQKLEARTVKEINRINLEIEKEKTMARIEMEQYARLKALEAGFVENFYLVALILFGTLGLVLISTLAYLLLRSGLARIPAPAAGALPAANALPPAISTLAEQIPAPESEPAWHKGYWEAKERAIQAHSKSYRSLSGRNGHDKTPKRGEYTDNAAR